MEKRPDLQPEKAESIQMLRAVAAIAVVMHHTPLLGHNGSWGVDLFFVISGFIMCYVTEASGQHFFTKRIIRVLPLYWMGTIGVFSIALFAPKLLQNTSAYPMDLLKSLLFIPFQKGALVQPVMFLGWTLNYEMLFYLCFAISIRLSQRFRAAVCSGILLALVAYGYFFHPASIPVKFWTSTIILEFIFGMLCFYAYQATRAIDSRDIKISARIPWLALGVICLACLPLGTYLNVQDRFVKYGLMAALSFYAILRGLAGVRLPSLLVMVGDASYSLYLFHPYIIQLLQKVLGVFNNANILAYLASFATVAVCCAIALLFYRYFEKPVTELLRKRLIVGQ
jgi:peptidoglycan/LPS O-acetylase OafA/YrhL